MARGYLPDTRSKQRRRQNALAQRNYRARQRERRRILERLAVSCLIEPSVSLNYGEEYLHARASNTVVSTHANVLNLTASEFFSCIGSYPERERQTFFMLMTKELFGIRDIIKYGLIFLGYPVSASLYNNAMFLPMRLWLQDVQQSLGHVDFLAAIKAGISLFGKLNVPLEGHHSRIHEIVASPDCIVFTRISFVSAVFINALNLGIPWCDLISFESESPFCRHKKQPTQNNNLGNGMTGSENPVSPTRSDLKPTHVQMMIPHHPTLDTIPWPSFRSKVIAAVHSDPPTIDREDFCLDLLNDGLRCWGFADYDSFPIAAPWDARNWEAAPWFLEKWEHLTDGRDGYEWKISAWWWSMGTRTKGVAGLRGDGE